MSLFQPTVLKEYLKQQDDKTIAKAYRKYTAYFHNPEIQHNIRASKEEQFQEGFLRELFVEIFGYIINPNPNYNLTTEFKNQTGARKADGAILNDGKAIAVIELKGTNTKDLESIRKQAFDYKANQSDCIYVITSNFEKLRFYIHNAVEFEEFNLFSLNKEQFALLYLCLSEENIKDNLPQIIKEKSIVAEEKITKTFYADYSLFKRELFRDLVKQNMKNEVFRTELQKEDTERANKNIKRALFKTSQKLIDRFLFIFFAEDCGLLPANSTLQILEKWQADLDFGDEKPLYDIFKIYFNVLDTGRKGTTNRAEIFAYNGGLFKPDNILSSLIIDDKLLHKHTSKLSAYDFSSQLDVNILGHIFENSLNEIESINAEIEGGEFDKQKSKRKKDGVFYTPKYITQYIVENTIGKLCKKKKQELGVIEEEYRRDQKGRKIETLKKLDQQLEAYRSWLLNIKICDPACGSGAFLNQALDFLIREHKNIDELKAALTTGGGLVFPNIENSILENNIYGVDINEESVEIAKLSLWLRTAQPRRKLTSLNNNIKCGNSLIDDPKVAGDKAFNWQKEFSEVFKDGGFDVIIGNPPYVFARENISLSEKVFYSKNYAAADYQINTYLLFMEKTVKLIKPNGNYGLIVPNAWLMVYSGKGLRKYLLENCTLNKIINLEGYSFQGVNVETVIIAASKQKTKSNIFDVLVSNEKEFEFSHTKEQRDFSKNKGFEFKVFADETSTSLIEKISKDSVVLDDIVLIKAGLKAYEKGKGTPKQSAEDVKNRIYDFDCKVDETTYKYLEGKDVGRYGVNWAGQYLKYGVHLAAPRSFNLFDSEKIIIREITGKFPKSIIATYDENIFLFNMSNIAIIKRDDKDLALKYIVTILNSTLMSYYFMKNTAKSVRKMFPKVILKDLRQFPFKEIDKSKQQPFIDLADKMLKMNKQLQTTKQNFIKELELEKTPKKLQDFESLTFEAFVQEYKKARKLKFTNKLEERNFKQDWEEIFEQDKAQAQNLHNQIGQADQAIDKMVYELYGLTEDEIKIVEANK